MIVLKFDSVILFAESNSNSNNTYLYTPNHIDDTPLVISIDNLNLSSHI